MDGSQPARRSSSRSPIPIVSRLLNTPSVRVVRGQSMPGMSYVYVIFHDGTDVGRARARVLEQMSALARCCRPAWRPGSGARSVGRRVGVSVRPAAPRRPAPAPALDELRAYQDSTLRHLLAAVPGVAEVATVGGHVSANTTVTVDPDRLRARGLALPRGGPGVARRHRRRRRWRAGDRRARAAGERSRPAATAWPALEARQRARGRGAGAGARRGDGVAARRAPSGAAPIWTASGDHVGGIVIMRDGENALAVIAARQAGAVRRRHAARGRGGGDHLRSVGLDRTGPRRRCGRALVEETMAVVLLVLAFLLHLRSAVLAGGVAAAGGSDHAGGAGGRPACRRRS